MNTDVKSWVWEEFSSRLEGAEIRIFLSLLGYVIRLFFRKERNGGNKKKRKIGYITEELFTESTAEIL